MKINPEILQRRLKQVRGDLLFWSQRAHLYRTTPFPHSAHKRAAERKVTALQREELQIMEQLGELDHDVTYLPPTQHREPTNGWKRVFNRSFQGDKE